MKKRFLKWLSSTVGKLHEHGISHCDIKLSNTLYSKSRDKFYLLDFGFSKYHNDYPIFCGTVIYMSPFMCKNYYSIIKKQFNGYYDNRENDRWALGIVAYVVYKGSHFIYKILKEYDDDREEAIANLKFIPLTGNDFFDKFISDHCKF